MLYKYTYSIYIHTSIEIDNSLWLIQVMRLNWSLILPRPSAMVCSDSAESSNTILLLSGMLVEQVGSFSTVRDINTLGTFILEIYLLMIFTYFWQYVNNTIITTIVNAWYMYLRVCTYNKSIHQYIRIYISILPYVRTYIYNTLYYFTNRK